MTHCLLSPINDIDFKYMYHFTVVALHKTHIHIHISSTQFSKSRVYSHWLHSLGGSSPRPMGSARSPKKFLSPRLRLLRVLYGLNLRLLSITAWWQFLLSERSSCHNDRLVGDTGPRLNIKTVFPDMVIPIIKIRQSWDNLIFIMSIPMLERWHLYIETALWYARDTTVLHWHIDKIS